MTTHLSSDLNDLPRAARFGVLRRWLPLAGVWMVLAVVVTTQLMITMHDHGHSWVRMFSWQVLGGLAFLAFGPLVFALARVARFDRPWIAVPVHLVAAAALAGVHIVIATGLSYWIEPFDPRGPYELFVAELMWQGELWLHVDILGYMTLLVYFYAVESRERQEARRLREERLRSDLARAELRALKLELQPHFLFNALHSVVSLVRAGDDRAAADMLVGLSDLLRASLDGRARQEVSLEDELETAELYLGIQRVRFSDRLRVEVDVAPEALDAAVPGLLLQPLLENAFRHGIDHLADGGAIRLLASAKGVPGAESGRLILRLENDGPDAGDSLSEQTAGTSGFGVGIDNVRSRLETLYGDPATGRNAAAWSLALRPRPGGGAVVELALPWRRAEPARRAGRPIGTRDVA